MGAPVEAVEVGGRSFSFGKLPPAEAVPVLWQLLPIMGAAQGVASEGAFSAEKIAGVASKLSGPDVFKMMTTMFKSVTLNGAPIDANFTFGDGVSQDMFAVFGHALRVNFASFLGVGNVASISSVDATTK